MLLLTRPDYERTTRYISTWAEKIVDLAKSKGYHTVLLNGKRATRVIFESMMHRHNPTLVFINGHGAPDRIFGQDGEVILQTGVNEKTIAGSITYALSCSSAKELGPKAVAAGATADIGYTGDFIFMWSIDKRTRPLEDKTAEMFLEPSNQIMTSLLKGTTTGEAVDHGRNAFAKNVRALLNSQSNEADTASLRYLLWDLQCLTLLGNPDTRAVD
jgi:hypothetical protein